MNTSNLPLQADSVTGKAPDKKDKEIDFTQFQNTGYAFDFGFTYNILPRLLVHGSVMDLGSITWNSKPYNYTLSNADVQLNGINYDQLNNADQRTNYTDSIVGLLKGASVTENGFNRKLRTRYFAGADWDFSFRDRIGFLFQAQQNLDNLYKVYTFSYTHRFGVNWDLTANYTMLDGKGTNVGIGTAVKMGAFQFYIIQDDILLYFKPATSQSFYFRMGLNLVWSEYTGAKISGKE